jgi:ABC-type nitrate/sulfonate/bicarbonate transport system ATPase subunit/ABC-type spermidine/putrescine transport system permease subunit II
MKPGLANAFLVGFIESMADFGNPVVVGGQYAVLSTDIFFAIVGAQYDQGRAASLALILTGFRADGVLHPAEACSGRTSYTTLTGKGDSAADAAARPRAPAVPRRGAAVAGFTVIVYVFAFIGGFVQTWGRDYTPTLKHFTTAFDLQWGEFGLVWAGTAWNSLFTTLKLAAIAAPLCAAHRPADQLAAGAHAVRRQKAFEFGALLAFAIPGTVLGVSYILAFNVPPFELTGTALIIVLCFVFRNLPVGVRAGTASFKQLDKSLDEASTMLRAGTATTLRRVVLPLLKPAVVAALVYSFVRSMTTVSAVVFLVTAENELATTYIIGRVGNGDYGVALAYCTVLIVLMSAGHRADPVRRRRAQARPPRHARRIERMSAGIEFRQVTKRYGDARAPLVVKGVDLVVPKGTLTTILGPSGCGKTTLLRMIAGLDAATAGTILIDGQDVTALGPAERNVSMVFQSYALFPHMNVIDNVATACRSPAWPRRGRAPARAAMESVGLAGYEQRLPSELSGGQQQRVAVARSLVLEPSVMLFDEPLSNLDARLRRACARRSAPAAAPEADGGLRHPRPERGAGRQRPDRGDERRADRAGRHAAAAVRAPAQRIRRRLHGRGDAVSGHGAGRRHGAAGPAAAAGAAVREGRPGEGGGAARGLDAVTVSAGGRRAGRHAAEMRLPRQLPGADHGHRHRRDLRRLARRAAPVDRGRDDGAAPVGQRRVGGRKLAERRGASQRQFHPRPPRAASGRAARCARARCRAPGSRLRARSARPAARSSALRSADCTAPPKASRATALRCGSGSALAAMRAARCWRWPGPAVVRRWRPRSPRGPAGASRATAPGAATAAGAAGAGALTTAAGGPVPPRPAPERRHRRRGGRNGRAIVVGAGARRPVAPPPQQGRRQQQQGQCHPGQQPLPGGRRCRAGQRQAGHVVQHRRLATPPFGVGAAQGIEDVGHQGSGRRRGSSTPLARLSCISVIGPASPSSARPWPTWKAKTRWRSTSSGLGRGAGCSSPCSAVSCASTQVAASASPRCPSPAAFATAC